VRRKPLAQHGTHGLFGRAISDRDRAEVRFLLGVQIGAEERANDRRRRIDGSGGGFDQAVGVAVGQGFCDSGGLLFAAPGAVGCGFAWGGC
jgi:hypothetical protein